MLCDSSTNRGYVFTQHTRQLHGLPQLFEEESVKEAPGRCRRGCDERERAVSFDREDTCSRLRCMNPDRDLITQVGGPTPGDHTLLISFHLSAVTYEHVAVSHMITWKVFTCDNGS